MLNCKTSWLTYNIQAGVDLVVFCFFWLRGYKPTMLDGTELLIDIDEQTDLRHIKILFEVRYASMFLLNHKLVHEETSALHDARTY